MVAFLGWLVTGLSLVTSGVLVMIARHTKNRLVAHWVVILVSLVLFLLGLLVSTPETRLWPYFSGLGSVAFLAVAPRFFVELAGLTWRSWHVWMAGFVLGTGVACSVAALVIPGGLVLLSGLAVLYGMVVLLGLGLLLWYSFKAPVSLSKRFLRRFFFLSACFVPLMGLDILATYLGWQWWNPFDNITLPLFLGILDALVLLESSRWLKNTEAEETNLSVTPVSGTSTAANLSERESLLIKLILQGASAKEIAVELGISPKTAENYTYRLYQKVGVRSRLQLYSKFRGTLQ